MESVLEQETPTLFNTNTKELDPYWIDPAQPLKIPINPLHFKAHKLQLLIERLDRQAIKNPAQFNSSNYLAIVNEFTKCVQMINEGKTADDIPDSSGVAEDGQPGGPAAVGDGTSSGVGDGISPDNPLAG